MRKLLVTINIVLGVFLLWGFAHNMAAQAKADSKNKLVKPIIPTKVARTESKKKTSAPALPSLDDAVKKITLAAEEDPFSIYYPLQFAKPDDFLMISMRHKSFGDCARWIRYREKGMDFSGTPQRSSGK